MCFGIVTDFFSCRVQKLDSFLTITTILIEYIQPFRATIKNKLNQNSHRYPAKVSTQRKSLIFITSIKRIEK